MARITHGMSSLDQQHQSSSTQTITSRSSSSSGHMISYPFHFLKVWNLLSKPPLEVLLGGSGSVGIIMVVAMVVGTVEYYRRGYHMFTVYVASQMVMMVVCV